jgi:hypothetical protein
LSYTAGAVTDPSACIQSSGGRTAESLRRQRQNPPGLAPKPIARRFLDAHRPVLAILPIGAERAVEDQRQEWRLRHRMRRAQRALDGDLVRFNAGSPGGWQPFRGARLRWGRGDRAARPVTGTWSAPTPPWPEGPKSGTRRLSHRVPRLNRGPCQAGPASRLNLRNFRVLPI